jgi:hypothetical protein
MLCFAMLRGQQSDLAICSLDRARLATAARRSDSLVHGGSEPVVRVRDLPAFPSGAIAPVSYVFLDKIDVVKHRVEDVLLRGDGELSAV